MKTKIIAGVLGALLSLTASADLVPWKDYTIGQEVLSVTTVKVDSNMIDRYLAGLAETWASSNDIAKEMGDITDYAIYVSSLPASGEFNVVLTVVMPNAAAMEPSEKRFNAFMKAWGKKNADRSEELVQTYPGIREITGEYLLRKITLK